MCVCVRVRVSVCRAHGFWKERGKTAHCVPDSQQHQIRCLFFCSFCLCGWLFSLNPAIDIGQVEGGYVMGLGYFLSEEIIYDPSDGRLVTDGTWEYKPPSSKGWCWDRRVERVCEGTERITHTHTHTHTPVFRCMCSARCLCAMCDRAERSTTWASTTTVMSRASPSSLSTTPRWLR